MYWLINTHVLPIVQSTLAKKLVSLILLKYMLLWNNGENTAILQSLPITVFYW